GVAFSTGVLRVTATIVMKRPRPEMKVDAVRSLAAEVVLAGDSYEDARHRCEVLQQETGATLIHPFDDPLVIAGQGPIGDEVLRQSQRDLSAVFVAVGGGGLITGIGSYIRSLMPDVRIIGVEPFE